MSETEVKVPNIGDFKDVEVIEVLVSEGQILKKNDPLITIESDKSSVEIPSNFEGKIKSLRTKVGDKVSEGDLILVLDSKSQLNEMAEEKQEIEKEFKKIKEIKPEIEQTQTKEIKTTSHDISSASPKARKFARELGADISRISGTQRAGRVSAEDVKKFIRSQVTVSQGEVQKKEVKKELPQKTKDSLQNKAIKMGKGFYSKKHKVYVDGEDGVLSQTPFKPENYEKL